MDTLQVCSVIVAVSHVQDYGQSTRFMAASMLRKVLGDRELTDVLSDRSGFNEAMKQNINDATIMMGIRVQRVEIASMSFPVDLRRVMAVEGLATQRAKAHQEYAKGELSASGDLAAAASVLSESPAAIQLRFMQTLNSIQHNTDNGSTLFFPFPMYMGTASIYNKSAVEVKEMKEV